MISTGMDATVKKMMLYHPKNKKKLASAFCATPQIPRSTPSNTALTNTSSH
jgi:hypothetical protein